MTDPAKSISAFYAGQSIFLTGATGFIGKVLIEKVLRSCPDVREIFLLMRPKKNLSANERLQKMLNIPLYEKLRYERPSSFEKLVAISGDASEKGLGLSAADKQMLIERVTIIIHGAASVKFNDSLRCAILTNTRGTRDVCILGQSMKNLKALVYISTAFTHTDNPFIEEKTYPPVADWQKMIEIAESDLDEHTLNIFTAKSLDHVPNTYIFSKKLSESIIQDYSFSLPCAIVRPSIVISSIEEPFPGWIDNLYGPIGISIAGGKGLLQVFYCNSDMNEDIVPVDIVIKAVLTTSWKLGLTPFTAGSTFILNCTSQIPMSFRYVYTAFARISYEIPLDNVVWTITNIMVKSFILYYILVILMHILPAILIDMILKFFGRQPFLVQLQRKMFVVSCALQYFSLHEWKFSNINSLALMASMSPDDRNTFSFDYSDCNIEEYFKNCIVGGKKFLLHEDMNKLHAAKVHSKRVYLFVKVVKSIVSIGALWIIYKWIFSYVL